MSVLLIAPLPPPITGHSVASQVVLDDLARTHSVDVVNLSIASSNDGTVTRRRIVEVGKVLAQVWRTRSRADWIYLTIAESFAGNVKDLLIYLLCAGRLSRVYVHLHGGSIQRLLFDPHPRIRRLNALALGRVGGIIISGRAHEHIFDGMIDPARIHMLPNFAPEHLFRPPSEVASNFASMPPLRVLYLSGMTEGKGYRDLVEGYRRLAAATQANVQLDMAGKFDSESERATFLREIASVPGIRYHGLVDEATKAQLFASAHLFVLPTTMFEGQPISILEAYASGCVVATTGQAGILDVFRDGANGFEIAERSPASIAAVLERASMAGPALAAIALHNRSEAEERYRIPRFTRELRRIMGIPDVVAG